ncbi:MAG: tetratricopeptide repeat protein, partial [Planctomycetaceae bacterium]|nr:tetratricopeptide repeat protein [Planctomycetaceae bacterium]
MHLAFIATVVASCSLSTASPLVASPFATLDKADDDFSLAVGFFRARRWQLSEEAFGQFVVQYPEHPRHELARLYLGLTYSAEDKYSLARDQFVLYIKSAKNDTGMAEARYRLAECSYHLKDYDQAITQFRSYLETHPKHTFHDLGLLHLGESYLATSDWQRAAATLMELSTKGNDTSLQTEARFGLAQATEGLKDIPESLRLYTEIAAEKDETFSPRALARMGIIHFEQQQYDDAIAAFDQIVSQYPTSQLTESASLNSGLACFRLKKWQEAIQRLTPIEAGSPGYAQAQFLSGVSHRELGQLEAARTALTAALTAARQDTLTQDILIQRAQLERQDGHLALAAQMYEDISDRWPQDPRTAESLFNAIELQLDLQQPAAASRYWNTLQATFSSFVSQPRQQILKGRVLLAEGKTSEGVDALQQALTELPLNEPLNRELHLTGRYLLVRTLFEQEKFTDVLREAQPVADLLQNSDSRTGQTILVMAGSSALQLGLNEEALRFAESYLAGTDDRTKEVTAVTVHAIALARLGKFQPLEPDVQLLTTAFAEQPATWDAILDIANAALEAKQPTVAIPFFQKTATQTVNPKVRETAMLNVAWAQFEAMQFKEADLSFGDFLSAFPQSALLPQASFMQARSVEQSGDPDRAAQLFLKAWKEIAGEQIQEAQEADRTPPLKYAFDAARAAARLLAGSQQTDQANTVLEQLATQFPNAASHDAVLNERALLNLNAEQFEVADQIFRTLLARHPASQFAGNARFALAESDLYAGNVDKALAEMGAIAEEQTYTPFDRERALLQQTLILSLYKRDWKNVIATSAKFEQTYPQSRFLPRIQILAGDAWLNSEDPEAAVRTLTPLRKQVIDGTLQPDPSLTLELGRVWVILGEAALLTASYAEIDVLEKELQTIRPSETVTLQMQFVQAKRFRRQAPPDFEKARRLFQDIVDRDPTSSRDLAIKSQFQIAETL